MENKNDTLAAKDPKQRDFMESGSLESLGVERIWESRELGPPDLDPLMYILGV